MEKLFGQLEARNKEHVLNNSKLGIVFPVCMTFYGGEETPFGEQFIVFNVWVIFVS